MRINKVYLNPICNIKLTLVMKEFVEPKCISGLGQQIRSVHQTIQLVQKLKSWSY
jgi:hypothetical protein